MSIDVVCVNNGKYNVFVIKNDEYIGPCIARGFEWDGWMRQDVSMYYKSGTDILDIGANIGYNTLIFSEFGPVHSFEPVYHGIVNKNAEINETKHPIKVYNCALSNEQREDEIHLPSRGCQSETLLNYGGTSFHHAPDMKGVGVRVKCEKLDDIYEGTPSILKIDVEGHELQALEGAKETITQHKPMILIEIHDFTEDNEVHKFIKDLGYNDPITRPEAMFLYTSA
jgi:FkbM family methyltransferase|tara:strand:- start:158 stop:835 length:678 start_codon:yes stop_codon:yes gene_type:complete